MPSANSGKKRIKSIKIFKDHVTLSFFKDEPLKISKEAFVSSYLYAGKDLSNKEINKLVEITARTTLRNYGLSLVSKKHYSEKEMLNKLLKKEDNYQVAKSVVAKLKENDLIDDNAFMQDLIAWDNERGFGQNKIKKHLKEKGISDSLINKATFPTSNEKKKARLLLEKLEKKYDKYNSSSKRQHVYQALISQGYSVDIAKEISSKTKMTSDKKEINLLHKDYEKAKIRYAKKYDGYQLQQKLYAYLINKGYRYQDIKKVLELEDFE